MQKNSSIPKSQRFVRQTRPGLPTIFATHPPPPSAIDRLTFTHGQQECIGYFLSQIDANHREQQYCQSLISSNYQGLSQVPQSSGWILPSYPAPHPKSSPHSLAFTANTLHWFSSGKTPSFSSPLPLFILYTSLKLTRSSLSFKHHQQQILSVLRSNIFVPKEDLMSIC